MLSFQPYANEEDVIRIDNLEIENRVDRVVLMGDIVLTKDAQGLLLARELHALLGLVVQALEQDDKEEKLPAQVELKPSVEVPNPFC